MDENRVTGAARETVGRVQDAVGGLTGNRDYQARGMSNQMQGQAENALGQLCDNVREQPLTSLAIAAGIGYILGRLRIL
ncbi:CsbD family protein [Pseudoroseomonas rhizosphaerae]|uniref:CsbD family protein n=1 Tax=Teichococcus rhizosphaerae TaxID=1335062 RepID=A0A2C7A8I8_9PROT|nr:CsbD family protein [Pseudoroseomonas rhizosphaerae]PHK93356.1 CsbD family protein [Pseudoroseomonas rhizosphaerae]